MYVGSLGGTGGGTPSVAMGCWFCGNRAASISDRPWSMMAWFSWWAMGLRLPPSRTLLRVPRRVSPAPLGGISI